MMDNIVREKLNEILTILGTDIYQTPSILIEILKDLAETHKAEVNALVLAVEEKIPQKLLSSSATLDLVSIAKLGEQLGNTYNLTFESARWAVETWAIVLSLFPEDELQTPSSFRNMPTQMSKKHFPTPEASFSLVSIPPQAPNPATLAVKLSDILTIEMVRISEGEFLMGGDTNNTEKPIREVKVKQFFMSRYPVTQAVFREVLQQNPSEFSGDDLPVEQVTWGNAQEFCTNLNIRTGKDKRFRLPSEAEWEYACRAGSTGMYSFGNDENLLGEYAWYYKNSDNRTRPVGQKKPNPWGLFDIHGNVWEWCEDTWHDNYQGAPVDGSPWTEGGDQSRRVIRGGSWRSNAYLSRSACRARLNANYRYYYCGFRVVLEWF